MPPPGASSWSGFKIPVKDPCYCSSDHRQHWVTSKALCLNWGSAKVFKADVFPGGGGADEHDADPSRSRGCGCPADVGRPHGADRGEPCIGTSASTCAELRPG